ncbi:unnamed protein product [Soboliphyme baturini]|uniref:ACAS_N domain-containing protein n=1 Tax=Soboliphyme baturini TaxID=241478 RepID=A0A183IYN5_9BILA|nr:unnamed protein product [Soboliphyme baturini]
MTKRAACDCFFVRLSNDPQWLEAWKATGKEIRALFAKCSWEKSFVWPNSKSLMKQYSVKWFESWLVDDSSHAWNTTTVLFIENFL